MKKLLLLMILVVNAMAFTEIMKPFPSISRQRVQLSMSPLSFFGNSSSKTAKIPTSPADRDRKAIDAVKAAIASPTISSFPLLECEFPILNSQNKLGDGSLRSTKQAEEATLQFVAKICKEISPVSWMGPRIWLIVSSSASNSFAAIAKARVKNAQFHSLRDGLPSKVGKGDICFVVTPSSPSDYQAAKTLTKSDVGAVVILNGFAKDPKSVPPTATMAYFLKPLTYNSQVAGYLTRSYPSKWTVLDAATKEILGSFSDTEILVKGTNTPDLRESGRLVQSSVNRRAIEQRKNQLK